MNEKQRHQRDYYKSVAESYDRKFRRENANHFYKIESIERCFAERLQPRSAGWRILEIGGGTGIHALHFMQAFGDRIREFVVSDLSPDMLAQAQKRLRGIDRISFAAIPAENMGGTGTFDGIYLSGAMHHFADPEKAVREMHTHLAPEGLAVVCEPNIWNPLNFLRACLTLKEDIGQFSVRRGRVRAMLAKNGFEIVSDRVLHFRAGNTFVRALYPYDRLEAVSALDPLAVMFLFAAVKKMTELQAIPASSAG